MSAVSIGVTPHIIHDRPILHPVDNYLIWFSRSAEALHNIWMLQSHPDGSFLVEFLSAVSHVTERPWGKVEFITFSRFIRSSSLSLAACLILLRHTLLLFEFSSTSSPLRTSANPPEAKSFSSVFKTLLETMYDPGSTLRSPQVLHKACKTFGNKLVPKFSNWSACSRGQQMYRVIRREPHLVQEVNEPFQPRAIKSTCDFFVFVAVVKVFKSGLKFPRGFRKLVEAEELWRRGHHVLGGR